MLLILKIKDIDNSQERKIKDNWILSPWVEKIEVSYKLAEMKDQTDLFRTIL